MSIVERFPVGATVVNLTSQIATVVGYKHDGIVLKGLGRDGKARGGLWLADPEKTRLLTSSEYTSFRSGAEIVR